MSTSRCTIPSRLMKVCEALLFSPKKDMKMSSSCYLSELTVTHNAQLYLKKDWARTVSWVEVWHIRCIQVATILIGPIQNIQMTSKSSILEHSVEHPWTTIFKAPLQKLQVAFSCTLCTEILFEGFFKLEKLMPTQTLHTTKEKDCLNLEQQWVIETSAVCSVSVIQKRVAMYRTNSSGRFRSDEDCSIAQKSRSHKKVTFSRSLVVASSSLYYLQMSTQGFDWSCLASFSFRIKCSIILVLLSQCEATPPTSMQKS